MGDLPIEEKIIRSKILLQETHPFFAWLLMNMDLVEDKRVPTMGVDHYGTLYYNTEWSDKLSKDELDAVLLHETMHCALIHFKRLETRHPEIFNIATDIVVNNILVNEGFHLPKDVIVPQNNEFTLETLKPIKIKDIDKKPAEEIYDEIYPKIPKIKIPMIGFDKHIYGKGENGKDNGNGQGKDKDKLKGNGTGIGEKKEKDWKRIITDATVVAKLQGKVPSSMERLIDNLVNPKINWRSLLYKYVTSYIPNDFTWGRPSRRSQSTGIYMPSVLKENVEIVVSIDTSGSIGQDELAEFMSEMIGIARAFVNLKMTIIVCDCTIKDVYELNNANEYEIKNIKIKGGGGTSHVPVYKFLNQKMPNTKLIINFTDAFTDFPDKKIVRTETIWVLCKVSQDEKQIPFGRIIKMK